MGIFDVFGKRDKPLPEVFVYTLPEPLRVQLAQILSEGFFKLEFEYSDVAPVSQVRRIILKEFSRFQLTEHRARTPAEDIFNCVLESPEVDLVLALVELSIRTMNTPQLKYYLQRGGLAPLESTIEEVNHRFRENGVGYFFDADAEKIIKISNTFLHDAAIKPTLLLLTEKRFKSANSEFLGAFDDYKKGDFRESITKTCAAFESVLKIICHDKWGLDKSKSQCADLVTTVVQNGGLVSTLTEPMKLIGTIRNEWGTVHGAGKKTKIAPEHLARYVLNLASAGILYIVESTR